MSAMCRRFLEALLTISGTGNCFPRPGRSLADGSFQDISQTRAADAKSLSNATQPAIDSITSQQKKTLPHHNNLLNDHVSNPHILTRRTSSSSDSSSSSTTPTWSLRSIPSTLRASLTRRVSSWQTNHSDPWPIDPTDEAASASDAETTTTCDEDFIASLDALALSQHEREVLGRMQLVCRSARAARERRLRTHDSSDAHGISGVGPGLCLRGGGDDEDVRPFRTPRRRTTLPVVDDPVFPKADSERPHRALWWLAGGRKGQVPTMGELRVRKEVERENRRRVGFWGTVLGVRRVGRVGILGEGCGGEVDVDADAGGSDGALENADAGSSHRTKSVGSIVGAPGAGGGSSLASSHREREIEVDHPVEAKAESVASVAGNAGRSKAGSLSGTAKDQESSRSRSIKDSGAAEPKVRSDSAKSVAEDHMSTKTGSAKDDGAEEPKARSESAKSVAGDTGVAEAESGRSRDGVTDSVGETETKPPSDG